MVEEQTERRGTSCSSGLLSIDIIKHTVHKKEKALEYAVPLRYRSSERSSKKNELEDGRQHYTGEGNKSNLAEEVKESEG